MSTVVKLSGSLTSTPLGASAGGVASEVDLGAWGPGVSYEDVRQREVWKVNTEGPVGGTFVDLDLPPTLAQLYVCSRNLSEVALRLNGTPASFHGYSARWSALVATDEFYLSVDQAPEVGIHLAAAHTVDDVIVAINGAVGHHVASKADDGQLLLVGQKSGGRYAAERGWQHGSLVIGGLVAVLEKVGLAPGTFYGDAVDLGVSHRFLFEPPTTGRRAVTRLEVSGSGELVTHVAGF